MADRTYWSTSALPPPGLEPLAGLGDLPLLTPLRRVLALVVATEQGHDPGAVGVAEDARSSSSSRSRNSNSPSPSCCRTAFPQTPTPWAWRISAIAVPRIRRLRRSRSRIQSSAGLRPSSSSVRTRSRSSSPATVAATGAGGSVHVQPHAQLFTQRSTGPLRTATSHPPLPSPTAERTGVSSRLLAPHRTKPAARPSWSLDAPRTTQLICRRGSGKPRLRIAGRPFGQGRGKDPGQDVVVVVYFGGVLSWVGPQDSSGVLHEPAAESDWCGEKQGVKNRAVESLPDVGPGCYDEQWRSARVRLKCRKGCFSSLHAHTAAKDNRRDSFANQRIGQLLHVGHPLGQDQAVPPTAEGFQHVGNDLLPARNVGRQSPVNGADAARCGRVGVACITKSSSGERAAPGRAARCPLPAPAGFRPPAR